MNKNYSDTSSSGGFACKYDRGGILLAIAVFFTAVLVHQNPWEDNQVSRIDLLYSMVLHSTLNIDQYHTNTPCKAFYKGHYYSDKPVGMVLLALPAFMLGVAICDSVGIPPESR